MTERSSGVSELDSRLAEIDRRLRAIQAELAPEREPLPTEPLPTQPLPTESRPTRPLPAEPRATEPRTASGRSGPLAAVLSRAPRAYEGPTGPEHAPNPEAAARPEHPGDLENPTGSEDDERRSDDPIELLVALTEVHGRLLSSMQELLNAYEVALARLPRGTESSGVREFTVSAGPFQSTAALRAFERGLAGISDVREVTVRGYEGEDRAIVDVRLSRPTA